MDRRKSSREETKYALLFVFSFLFLAFSLAVLVSVPPDMVLISASPFVVFLLLFSFYMFKKVKKRVAILASILLVSFSLYSAFAFLDSSVHEKCIPKVEITAWALIEIFGEREMEWVDSSWNFFEPECYSEYRFVKLENHSLYAAGFSYEYRSKNPFHIIVQHLYRRLSCGYVDAREAFERYEDLLSSSGFSIEKRENSFIARNESTVVYCTLDGDVIVVIRVNKSEEELLSDVGEPEFENGCCF